MTHIHIPCISALALEYKSVSLSSENMHNSVGLSVLSEILVGGFLLSFCHMEKPLSQCFRLCFGATAKPQV